MTYTNKLKPHEFKSWHGKQPLLSESPDGSPSTLAEHRQSPLRFALTEYFPRLKELRATNSEYLNRCALCFHLCSFL